MADASGSPPVGIDGTHPLRSWTGRGGGRGWRCGARLATPQEQQPKPGEPRYGQLLLEAEPVSLDALAEALELSKGAVSTSVRELVSWGLARTISQPGSRRLLVEATGGLESLLSASHDRARSFIHVLREGEGLTQEPHVQQRLHDVTDLFEGYIEAGEDLSL